MVSHINRAVTIDGTVTKHKRALNPHGPHTVPRSLDGFSRASAEYLPIAYICHRGPTHDTGHYFAILVYKDLMWIADDGAELSPWFHVTTGVAAGCPQAPLLAKTFLQPILKPATLNLNLNGWVDDIGIDGSHHDAQRLANRTIQAWHELRDNLKAVGLVVNSQKNGLHCDRQNYPQGPGQATRAR